MPIQKTVCCVVLLFGSIALAQTSPFIKTKRITGSHNPQAVGCRDGKPVNVMEEMQKNWEKIQKENQFKFHSYVAGNGDRSATNPSDRPSQHADSARPYVSQSVGYSGG